MRQPRRLAPSGLRISTPRPFINQPGRYSGHHDQEITVNSILSDQSENRIREALQFVSPADRDTWLRMGMAIHAELGDHGFDTWNTWSQQAESYKAKDARDVWKSFHAGGGVGIGTLLHEARANGWHDSGTHQKPSPAEIAERKRIAAERAAKEQAEETRKNEAAAIQAAAILAAASGGDPAQHPYAMGKDGVDFGPLVKRGTWPQRGWVDALLIPIYDADGRVWSLQAINTDGEKDYLKGGRKRGGFHPFGNIRGAVRVLICEGMTNAAVVHAVDGAPAVAAMDAGNLPHVAEAVRKLAASDAELVFTADNDVTPDGSNPGLKAAREAAALVGGRVAVPELDGRKCDFWDVWHERGPEAVARAIASATAPVRGEHHPGSYDAPAGESAPEYPEPMPLPKLPPVPEFPIELLPDDLAAWIGDAAERARFRPDFAAAASMVALGSVIGRKLGIRLKQRDDWTEYANVWGGLIGPPSALKSPAMRAAMRPFKTLQVTADERHAKERESYEAQLEIFKLRKDAKKKSAAKALTKDADASIDLGDRAPPNMPIPRTYWTSNVNEASLGVLLEQNPNGLLIERDELSSLMVSLENEQNADLRGMMLSGHSGNEGYRFDRIMRGTTALPKFAISVVGGIQPGPLARYVRSAFSGERADGLLQRFQLLVWPDPEDFEYVDRYPDGPARKAAAALFERADNLDAEAIGSNDDYGDNPPFVHLSNAAQGLFVEWYSAFMRERRAVEAGGGESAPIAAHFGKYPGLVGKLALIIHVADDPASREVSERTLLKALAWIDYLTPHARRVYHSVEHPETGAAELLLSRLRRGELPASFKAWEINRKGWHGLTDREAVKKACRLLFEYGWLIELDAGGATGGRPADPVYAVSPAVRVAV